MKSIYRLGAAGAAVVTALSLASAAQAAPVTEAATARAEIVQALTVTNTTDLDFGKIAVTAAGGTVVVSPAGAVSSCAAALTCYSTTSAASFDVTGSFNKSLTVTLPTLATTLSRSGGVAGVAADELELSAYTTDAAAVSGQTYYSVVLDAAGTGSFAVGGTLTFDGSEVEGVYTGSFDVNVDYL